MVGPRPEGTLLPRPESGSGVQPPSQRVPWAVTSPWELQAPRLHVGMAMTWDC